MAYTLSREKFNGVVGRGAPHNTALKHKPLLLQFIADETCILMLDSGARSSPESCRIRPRKQPLFLH